jgi:hypothetical protein
VVPSCGEDRTERLLTLRGISLLLKSTTVNSHRVELPVDSAFNMWAAASSRSKNIKARTYLCWREPSWKER